MKNVFQRLSKAEQKEAIRNYYATSAGEENKKRFKRIFIYGVVCLLYGTFLIIEEIINHASNANYVLGTLVIIAGCVFLIGGHKAKVEKVNSYLVSKRKK